jgi:AcrR family transcriptional regulator
MSKAPVPRRHLHLSRAAIAKAALEIVDSDGLEALNLRGVAASLGVGTMTLYRYVPDRDSLLNDIVGLLLSEVDTTEKPGEQWDETIRRVTRSVHQMGLRHPLAYGLVALAPEDQSPVLEHARRIEELHAAQQIPEELFIKMWSVVDAFSTGFMLLEAKAHTGSRSGDAGLRDPETASLAAHLPEAQTSAAFDEGLEVVIAGLRLTLMAHDWPPRSSG